MTEEMESGKEQIEREAPACPMHALHEQAAILDAGDELVLPMHKRVITQ
jgi:hypothetical protein